MRFDLIMEVGNLKQGIEAGGFREGESDEENILLRSLWRSNIDSSLMNMARSDQMSKVHDDHVRNEFL